MNYTVYDLALLFLVYSFLGWVIETIVATVKKKTFINRGFFSGPFCFIYGISAVIMTVALWELKARPFFLFIGCAVFATAIEWFTGKILERMNQQKWWDYSDKKWNFDGYICLQYSILWGILGMAALLFFNGLFLNLFGILPDFVEKIIVITFVIIAVLDGVASMATVFYSASAKKEKSEKKRGFWQLELWNRYMWLWTIRLGSWIAGHIERRMEKAYPAIKGASEKTKKGEADDAKADAIHKENKKFAQGCSFFKLFWLFVIGAFLGDIVETVFCRFTMGYWMSRSSLVWGPFSIVWGLAIALATVLLYKDRDKEDRHIFFIGTVLGGAYEYLCSVFTEIVFGKVFWDYSHIPFNLGGRVNLLYCFFWGIAAVVWIKILYPGISAWIEKIPKKPGTVLTWLMMLFMAVNILVSMMALIRYDSRSKGEKAESAWEQVIDAHFTDERMEWIYPNAKPR